MFDFPNAPAVGQVFSPAGGPSWQWDGVAWTSFQTAGETAINRIFVPGVQGSATNYTYNKPANLRHLEIEGVAAGGSGAPAIATTASIWSHGSSGGGGSWGRKLFKAAEVPASVAAVIGAPGAGSSAGNGNTAADTTLAALGLTLPGGLRGNQGANTAYGAIGTAASSNLGAPPTGWDVYKAGEPSDGTTVSLTGGGGAVWAIGGRSGWSPWGTGSGSIHGTGWGSTGGYGYGWGSGGCVNAGSAALKSSVAGGPGALLFTEYLAVEAGAGLGALTANTENMIVNPDFIVSQENGSTATAGANVYCADQWLGSHSSGGVVSWQQLIGLNTPGRAVGRLLVTTADAAVAVGDYAGFFQYIEGNAIRDLLWPVAGTKPVVLRFTMYANVAGTYCAAIRDGAAGVSYVMPFTHPGASYAEYVFAIPSPTIGTWPADSQRGMILSICGMAGTTYQAPSANTWVSGAYLGTSAIGNIMAAVNNEMRIGRVGLYSDPAGTGVPPPFAVPDYATELMKCLRYYEAATNAYMDAAVNASSGVKGRTVDFKVVKRASPLLNKTDTGAATTIDLLTANGFRMYTGNTTNSIMTHWSASARM